ncbi:MAG TPA: hypothetical protein VGL03_11800 [Thermoanaerobaculia bacterium]
MDGNPDSPQAAESLSRPQAIALVRERLKSLCDDEHCACAAAAHFGVFCGGLRNLSDEEFRRRFDWIARTRPRATRGELEKVVSLYHIGRQEVTGAELCCDVETREHCACDGWNMFDNRALERICMELTGRSIRIA